jgi:hypothetical protein
MRSVIGLAFQLIVMLFKTRSPILWGIAVGLAGAVLGTGAGLLLQIALHSVYPFEIWFYVPLLIGYPIGACYGITLANVNRDVEGSTWLALLGAFSGAALCMAIWRLIDGSESLRAQEGLSLLAQVAPAFLIPALSMLAYNFKLPSGWGDGLVEGKSRHSFHQAASHPEPPPGQEDDDLAKVMQALAQSKYPNAAQDPTTEAPIDLDEAAGPRTCGDCAMESPPGSIFCDGCGSLLWASGT